MISAITHKISQGEGNPDKLVHKSQEHSCSASNGVLLMGPTSVNPQILLHQRAENFHKHLYIQKYSQTLQTFEKESGETIIASLSTGFAFEICEYMRVVDGTTRPAFTDSSFLMLCGLLLLF